MSDAGKDEIRPDLPYESKQPNGAMPDASCVKLVDGYGRREVPAVILGGQDQAEVDHVLLRME